MSDMLLQAGMWVVAAGAMILFLKRRRSRKSER